MTEEQRRSPYHKTEREGARVPCLSHHASALSSDTVAVPVPMCTLPVLSRLSGFQEIICNWGRIAVGAMGGLKERCGGR